MRCAVHDLACGPDGRCVLCRRSLPPPSSRATTGLRIAFVVVGAVIVATGAIGVVGRLRSSSPATSSTAPIGSSAPLVTTAQPTATVTQAAAVDTGASAPLAVIPDDVNPSQREADEREQRIQAEMKKVQITVYTTSWCPACKQARAWLGSHDIAYTERDVDHDRAAFEAWKRLSSAHKIPLFDIEGDVRVGLDAGWVMSSRRRIAEGRVQFQ